MQQDVLLEAADGATAGETPQQAGAKLTAHRRALQALTGIRFLAAVYVVVFHTRTSATLRQHGWTAAGNFVGNGYLAVPLFFLLSGFILAYTYRGQIERQGDHRRFWEARFARIWPVYAISLLLSSVPSLVFPPFKTIAATVFMVQAWNPFDPGMAGAWNAVCWTLSVEALFYLVFPWLQVWLEDRSERGQALWTGLMLVLSVAINSGGYSLGNAASGLGRWLPLPVLHLPEFFIGVGLGNLYLERLQSRSVETMLPGRGAWTYLTAALSLGLLCRATSYWTSLVVAAFAALIFGLAAERTWLSRLLSTRTMLLGGGISYSVYLMQMPVKLWVALAAARLHLDSEMGRMTLTFAVLLVVSFILFKTVEEPARKVLRSMFARIELRRDAARSARAGG